jgi:hypothetical protein
MVIKKNTFPTPLPRQHVGTKFGVRGKSEAMALRPCVKDTKSRDDVSTCFVDGFVGGGAAKLVCPRASSKDYIEVESDVRISKSPFLSFFLQSAQRCQPPQPLQCLQAKGEDLRVALHPLRGAEQCVYP